MWDRSGIRYVFPSIGIEFARNYKAAVIGWEFVWGTNIGRGNKNRKISSILSDLWNRENRSPTRTYV
jgi:hypothetical protein